MDKFISIKEVMDDLLDHPLLQDLTFERVINYTIHFIRIVGMPKLFTEKTATLEIQDYRASLPCDYVNIIQVRTREPGAWRYFRSSTDTFHMSNDKSNSSDLTYKIQGSVIFTSIKEGTIEISYRALPIDCEGYPMIPDDSSFIRALEAFITTKKFKILFDLGEMSQVAYDNNRREYAFAVGQAQSRLVMPSIDEMESITNMWNTLIPRVTQHSTGFVNNGTKELIRQH